MISASSDFSAIRIKNAVVKHADLVALNNITVNITKGKWTSIIGPNGAGKSTLLRVCAGLQGDPSSVVLNGDPLSKIAPAIRARHIAWLGQNESVQGDMSVYDLVMLGRLPHLSWFDTPSEKDHLIVRQALEIVHATQWKDRSIGQLSGGEQQRVFIARALAVDAEILLMDEPLSNLDPPHQSDCLHLIRSLVAQRKTVVTVLHEVAFALCADDIIVMNAGAVYFQGMSHEVTTQQKIEQVFQNRIEIQSFKNRLVVLPV
jgi:iron complex transport system ATP-binding protein